MTRAAVKSINCTSCGAGLSVLGGGRVTAHICGYCGAELDALREYRVLRQFADMKRPDSPLKLGDEGQINGVTYTVIGTLGMTERHGKSTWHWVDHQIFSATHGYGYLTVENGHLLFSRRMRVPTRPIFLSAHMVARAESPPVVHLRGEAFRYYEESNSTITFAEGEFNWTPEIGMQQRTISALGETAMLSFSKTASEQEVEITTYLPPETWASFGVTSPPERQGTHPLQAFKALGFAGFLRNVSFAAAAICLALTVFFMMQQGRQALPLTRLGMAQLPVELPIEITQAGRLATIELGANVSNSWAYIEVELLDPEDEPVFIAGREVGYYFGRDSDGAWTEGSRRTRLRFRPEVTGTYTLGLSVDETGAERGGSRPSEITVEAKDNLPGPLWTALAALLFVVLGALPWFRSILFTSRRWSGSDWSDDD